MLIIFKDEFLHFQSYVHCFMKEMNMKNINWVKSVFKDTYQIL